MPVPASDPQPEEEEAEEETDTDENEGSGPNIRWLDVRFNGSLIMRVNADNPCHIQMMIKSYGQRRVIEFDTKSASLTGAG